MKKTGLMVLFCLLATIAPALNFFGIEHNGNTTDNIINLIYSMVQDDAEMVDEYYGRLQNTDPKLAKKVKPDELKIPCTRCRGKGILGESEPCPVCEGSTVVADPHALGYLQHKFSLAIDNGATDAAAWRKAKAAFDERRDLVLSREALFGTVIRREGDGLLLSRQGSGEIVLLRGCEPSLSRKGTPLNGHAWLMGTHVITGEDGEPLEIKSYTVSLWID